jgi:hypothetical protein
MHSCLQIFEILDQIFHHVYYDSSQGQTVNARDTLMLTLTCHSFEDVALNILWHTQTDFVRLIKVLPSRRWLESGRDVFDRDFVSAPVLSVLRSAFAQIFTLSD